MLKTPLEFFGVEPGSERTLIVWDKIVDYFYHLEENSPCIKVFESGKTTLGNPFIYAIITSEANMARLDEYKEISRALADPKGLSDTEIAELAGRGKAVYVQTHGVHSSEPAGTQLSPVLAYELITGKHERACEILDNVIFILFPCVNPDGEIMVTNWYNKYLGTENEGLRFPGMYHIYARHCNNRDFVHENLVETKYINDVIIRDWMPQMLIDHHQQIWDENRISIPPCVNPIWPELSPLLTREEQSYGYQLASEMEEEGYVGVVAGDSWYNTFPIYSLAGTYQHSNILAMLVETADAHLASPAQVPKEKLWRYTKKCVECPTPWEGGEWTFSDVIRYTKKVSYSMLHYAARDREMLLRRRAKKAYEQTEKGARSPIKGYLIPRDQHDNGALARLLHIMDRHGIEYTELAEDFTVNETKYPKGTYYVSNAQARYSLVALLFARHPYPIEPSTVWEDGTVHVFDSSSTNIIDPLGLDTVECTSAPTCLSSPTKLELGDDMPENENESFRRANVLLREGKRVWRDEAGKILLEEKEDAHEIKAAKIAILSPSRNDNGFMGYARLTLEKYSFDLTVIDDKSLRAGALDAYDILILAGHTKKELEAGDSFEEGIPEEYKSGLGTDGKKEIERFVARGGKIIAWDKSCTYIANLFSLPIIDTTGGKGGNGGLYDANKEYLSQGSILNINVNENDLTLGMPKDVRIKHNSGPAYEPTDDSIEIFARYNKENCFNNGLIIGEELICGHGCALRTRVGNGEIILYTFDPFYRAQALGTFKLVFNALYR